MDDDTQPITKENLNETDNEEYTSSDDTRISSELLTTNHHRMIKSRKKQNCRQKLNVRLRVATESEL